MEYKQIKTLKELKQNWKNCFIPSIPRLKKPNLKTLIEGFNLGLKILIK